MGLAALLWQTSEPYRHEPWFQERMKAYLQFKEFRLAWENIRSDHWVEPHVYSQAGDALMQTRFLDDPIQESTLLVPMNRAGDLMLMFSIPKDDAARHIYHLIGCDISNLRLDEMLNDLDGTEDEYPS